MDMAKRYLLSGDCVFYDGKIMLLSIHDGRIQEYNNSIKILSALEFDALLLVYLSISLNNGKEHIKKASSYFEKGMIPPNIIYGYSFKCFKCQAKI